HQAITRIERLLHVGPGATIYPPILEANAGPVIADNPAAARHEYLSETGRHTADRDRGSTVIKGELRRAAAHNVPYPAGHLQIVAAGMDGPPRMAGRTSAGSEGVCQATWCWLRMACVVPSKEAKPCG